MNRYKIIFPYQSQTTHLAKDKFEAFDLCFDEMRRYNLNPNKNVHFGGGNADKDLDRKIFVVLDLNSNMPYYLEINDEFQQNKNDDDNENENHNENENKSIKASFDGDKLDNFGKMDQLGKSEKNQEEPFRDSREKSGILAPSHFSYCNSESNKTGDKYSMFEKRIDLIETELVKMKMKMDYMQNLHRNMQNMNNNIFNNTNTNTNTNANSNTNTQIKQEEDDMCIIL